ncbi:ABC transporter ATP-binding protein [Halobacillus sp. MO56]
MNKVILQASGVSKRYGKKQVLDKTDISISAGECVVLCGGNGAGKSTLIRVLTGIERGTTGKVMFPEAGGKSYSFMPDHMEFPKEMTALEILSYYRGFLDTGVRRDAEEVLREVGLWEKRHQKIGSFSKGMAQRLNMAQALLADVELYIFDEPTNGLDPYWVIAFKEMVESLKHKGKTVLLISHIMRDVVDIADRVVVLFEGRIEADDSLAGLYRTYQSSNLEEVFLRIMKKQNSSKAKAVSS